MSVRSNIDAYWDEFCDWCEDFGDIDDPRDSTNDDDWGLLFACWNAALDARDSHPKDS